MKQIALGNTNLAVPAVAVGCMRVDTLETAEFARYLEQCLAQGLCFFDHADIYGDGLCEQKFAEAFRRTSHTRQEILLQSKCGIVEGKCYDLSKEHILRSVEGSLARLGTDYLDVLLLHRPDALLEPEEVAEAFDRLQAAGKVRFFGVSNFRPSQIALLQQAVAQKLLLNQMQFSIPCSSMIASGLEANLLTEGAVDRDGGCLDYCRLNGMTVQAWSPFQYGFFEGVFLGSEKYPELNAALERMALAHNATPTGIATAWILRHPAHIQMIAGTTKPARMQEIVRGSEVELSREEWYELYLSAGHILP